MTTHFLFFYYFSGVAIVSSILTVGLKNPVYCTLALLSSFFHVAGLFILLQAEFVAAVQIIVYAGAVLVLYLFVLMLLNLKSTEMFFHRQLWVSLLFGLVILGEILLALFQPAFLEKGNAATSQAAAVTEANTKVMGIFLFNEYVLQFEVVGVLLLGAVVGALILAKQTPPR